MKISSVYGKEIISTDGKQGYVLSVHANGTQLRYLLCADENEKEFTVDVNSVVKFGERIVYKESGFIPEPAPSVRLGRAVFDEKGAFVGVLSDLVFEGNRLEKAKIGKKNYPAEGLVYGDAAILKTSKILRQNVEKDGKVILKKGTPLNAETLETAYKEGEYVQAKLKSLV